MKLSKRILLTCWFVCLGMVVHHSSGEAAATSQGRNQIQSLTVETHGKQEHFVLTGTQVAKYTTFALDAPPRLVVDLQNSDLSALKGPFSYTNRLVTTINLRQFTDPAQSIGRLVILLKPKTRWLIRKEGVKLVVMLRRGKTPQIKGAAAKPVKAGKKAPLQQGWNQAQAPKDKRLPSRAANTKIPKPNGIVQRSGLRQGPTHTRRARRLLGISVRSKRVTLRTDGSIAQFELLTLRNPTRMVVDLYQVRRFRSRIRRQMRRITCAKYPFRNVRFGRHINKLRLVFDLCQPNKVPVYRLRARRRGLRIDLLRERKVLRRKPVRAKAPRLAKARNAKSSRAQKPRLLSTGPTLISNVGFGQTSEHSTLMIQMKGRKARVRRKRVGELRIFDISPARLSASVQQNMDTSEFKGPIESVNVFPRGSGVRVTLRMKRDAIVDISNKAGLLKLRVPLKPEKFAQAARKKSYKIDYNPRRVGQAAAAPAGGGALTAGDLAVLSRSSRVKKYTGRRISIFFRKVEIHNLLRLFAEISGLNIITSDRVKGAVTLRLRNVPWDQALNLVLKTLRLGMEREGNIVRIATLNELRQEQQERRRLQQVKLLAQPQKIRLIPVNYAIASAMAAQVQSVLSPRGKVTTDARTNVLIVKDYVPFLIRAEGLVRSLDTQTPQVLIETRIVEANINFDQQFGIQWGGHLLFSPLTGNGTGLQFPNPIGIRGGASGQAGGAGGAAGGAGGLGGDGNFGTPNYIINFPATIGQGRGTALGFLFGSLTGATQLNLRLSAAESRGHVKVISSPKIITLHKMSASIQQGLQIPFTSASAAGTNVQFIAASLALTVSPQVTTDGSIFLTMNISNNQPDFSRGGAAGPAISTKTAQTKMLIKDGETMVIGGVYSRRTGTSQSRVPFLSSIPVLGLLFKNYTYNDDRAELLIFVTPRIINRAQTLGGRQGS